MMLTWNSIYSTSKKNPVCYLELRVNDSRARIDLWKHHVERDLHVTDHISIGYLNVLHFCRIGLTLEGLNTDELNLN